MARGEGPSAIFDAEDSEPLLASEDTWSAGPSPHPAAESEDAETLNHAEAETDGSDSDRDGLAVEAGSSEPTISRGYEALASDADLACAVAKVFEQTAVFRGRFDDLNRAIAELGRIGARAEDLIEPLRTLHDQLANFAESLGPMRALQAQLGRMATTFAPMRVLHDQMTQLTDAVRGHLTELVPAIELATRFRSRVLALAGSLEDAEPMQAGFDDLYSTFGDKSQADGLNRDGLPS
ncbi:MAG TPA: hypothetical protein VJ718_11125 [Candidatus Binataceae bacterium]|nr:hypothetical protein [Candidatus Binataceae bacterium]